jgi:hypothetical protein
MDLLKRIAGWVKAHGGVVHLTSELVVIVGLPIAVYQLAAQRWEAHNHALEAHEQVYSGLDAQYTDFLKLCLQYPKLDCYDLPADPPLPKLEDGEKAQQRMLYAILIPMLEHAYLAYHGRPAAEIAELTQAQWPGWKKYATSFMNRPAFRAVWNQLGDEFDSNFKQCMDSLNPAANGKESDLCNPWSPSLPW